MTALHEAAVAHILERMRAGETLVHVNTGHGYYWELQPSGERVHGARVQSLIGKGRIVVHGRMAVLA